MTNIRQTITGPCGSTICKLSTWSSVKFADKLIPEERRDGKRLWGGDSSVVSQTGNDSLKPNTQEFFVRTSKAVSVHNAGVGADQPGLPPCLLTFDAML